MMLNRNLKMLALAIVLSAVAVCVFAEGQAETTGEGTGPVELRWMHGIWGAEPDPEGYLPARIEEELGVRVNFEFIPEKALLERRQLLVASNDLPDVMGIQRPTNMQKWATSGVFHDLTEYWNDYGTLSEHYPLDSSVLKNSVVFDDRVYGVPFRWQNTGRMLGVRQDWLDNLGLEAPQTVEEFYEVARAFTFDDPDGNGEDDTYGLALDKELGLAWVWSPAFNGLKLGVKGGVEFPYDGDGNIVAAMVHPNLRDFVQFLARLYQDGLVDPGSIVLNDNDAAQKFNQGTVGFTSVNTSNLNRLENDVRQNEPDASVSLLLPLRGLDGERRHYGSNGVFRQTVVSTQASEAQARAFLEVIDWALGRGYETWTFGVEGVHWSDKQNGVPIVNDSWGGRADNWKQYWLIVNRNEPSAWVSPEMQTTEYAERLAGAWSDIQPHLLLPAVDQVDQLPESYVDFGPDLEQIKFNGIFKIMVGDEPIDHLEEVVSNWRSRGGDQVIIDMNAALEESGLR